MKGTYFTLFHSAWMFSRCIEALDMKLQGCVEGILTWFCKQCWESIRASIWVRVHLIYSTLLWTEAVSLANLLKTLGLDFILCIGKVSFSVLSFSAEKCRCFANLNQFYIQLRRLTVFNIFLSTIWKFSTTFHENVSFPIYI